MIKLTHYKITKKNNKITKKNTRALLVMEPHKRTIAIKLDNLHNYEIREYLSKTNCKYTYDPSTEIAYTFTYIPRTCFLISYKGNKKYVNTSLEFGIKNGMFISPTTVNNDSTDLRLSCGNWIPKFEKFPHTKNQILNTSKEIIDLFWQTSFPLYYDVSIDEFSQLGISSIGKPLRINYDTLTTIQPKDDYYG